MTEAETKTETPKEEPKKDPPTSEEKGKAAATEPAGATPAADGKKGGIFLLDNMTFGLLLFFFCMIAGGLAILIYVIATGGGATASASCNLDCVNGACSDDGASCDCDAGFAGELCSTASLGIWTVFGSQPEGGFSTRGSPLRGVPPGVNVPVWDPAALFVRIAAITELDPSRLLAEVTDDDSSALTLTALITIDSDQPYSLPDLEDLLDDVSANGPDYEALGVKQAQETSTSTPVILNDPCLNNCNGLGAGTCLSGSCSCNFGFYGIDCADQCTRPIHCNGNGDCNDDAECVCDPGFIGSDCATAVPHISSVSPADGSINNNLQSVVRVQFSEPAVITGASFTVRDGSSNILSSTATLSGDDLTASITFSSVLPDNDVISVTADSAFITTVNGGNNFVVGDNPVSVITSFETVDMAPVASTRVCGVIRGDNGDNLGGVVITTIGAATTVTTAANGAFCLGDVPLGTFFVTIDADAAANGGGVISSDPNDLTQPLYSSVVKPFTTTVSGGDTNMGDIFLTIIPANRRVNTGGASATITNGVDTFPSLSIPAGGLGSNPVIGIIEVSPSQVPLPLTDDLSFPSVFSIRADEFTTRIPACFPNDGGLAADSPAAVWSFNDATGAWEPVSTATVASDGMSVCSDAGQGLKFPGWHGVIPAASSMSVASVCDPNSCDDENTASSPCVDSAYCCTLGSPPSYCQCETPSYFAANTFECCEVTPTWNGYHDDCCTLPSGADWNTVLPARVNLGQALGRWGRMLGTGQGVNAANCIWGMASLMTTSGDATARINSLQGFPRTVLEAPTNSDVVQAVIDTFEDFGALASVCEPFERDWMDAFGALATEMQTYATDAHCGDSGSFGPGLCESPECVEYNAHQALVVSVSSLGAQLDTLFGNVAGSGGLRVFALPKMAAEAFLAAPPGGSVAPNTTHIEPVLAVLDQYFSFNILNEYRNSEANGNPSPPAPTLAEAIDNIEAAITGESAWINDVVTDVVDYNAASPDSITAGSTFPRSAEMVTLGASAILTSDASTATNVGLARGNVGGRSVLYSVHTGDPLNGQTMTVVRGSSSSLGTFSVAVPPNTPYTVRIHLRDVTVSSIGYTGYASGISGPIGQTTDLAQVVLRADEDLPDADSDDLSDVAELIYGSDPNNANTDGTDGNDGNEVRLGTDPTGA